MWTGVCGVFGRLVGVFVKRDGRLVVGRSGFGFFYLVGSRL